jgi:hypothetical protein
MNLATSLLNEGALGFELVGSDANGVQMNLSSTADTQAVRQERMARPKVKLYELDY